MFTILALAPNFLNSSTHAAYRFKDEIISYDMKRKKKQVCHLISEKNEQKQCMLPSPDLNADQSLELLYTQTFVFLRHQILNIIFPSQNNMQVLPVVLVYNMWH